MEKVNKSDVIFSKKQGLFDKWGKRGGKNNEEEKAEKSRKRSYLCREEKVRNDMTKR